MSTAPAAGDRPSSPGPEDCISPRLLVIDDEPGVREGCRRTLAACGYEADVAPDAEQGLRMLQDADYCLVFVDLKMPGMDGLEFLAEAQRLGIPSVFVVITAYATLSMAVDATKRGAYDFVAKPFTPDELISVTERALAHAALVRERDRLAAERDSRLLELATEKGRLRSVVESMTDGVIVTNRDGQVVLYNAAALRVSGCGLAPAEARMAATCIGPPELAALVAEAAAAEGVERFAREIRVGPDPHDVMMASVSPVTDDMAQCLGVVTVLSDISELKRVELLMAQFVNMVAHELRAPLAAIDSQVTAIRQGFVPDREQQDAILDRAHLRLQGLLELVNDLLTLSRLDARAATREVRPQNLGTIAHEVCALLQPTAQEHSLSLSLDVPDDLPLIEADQREMTVVLTNLLSNAIKYNRPAGSVSVRLRDEAPYVAIEVSDTGVGISEDGQHRVFEEFYRERTPLTQMLAGTGLGLSIVARIVRSYHGAIDVHSELGTGSTFTVRLPLDQGSAESSMGDSDGRTLQGRSTSAWGT